MGFVRMMAAGAMLFVLALHEMALALRLGLGSSGPARGGFGWKRQGAGEKDKNEQRFQHGSFQKQSQWPKVRQNMKAVMPALRQEMTMRASPGSIRRA
jgi:hypothetical protein